MLRIHRSIGHKSRTAGIALAVLSLLFLVLSLYFSNNIIFQVDSIVCLLAAIAVFLRGESSSMQLRIVNRMLVSSNEILGELSSLYFGTNTIFTYTQIGNKVTDVVVVANTENRRPAELETSTTGESSVTSQQSDVLQNNLIPPGRALAELYQRELNIILSTDLLIGSLRSIICERFELATSLSVKQSQDASSIGIVLGHPAIRQSCAKNGSTGVLGCPISSMLAILFCYASKRFVRIEQCTFDSEKNELKVLLRFGPPKS